jgi:hypothetical protein
MHGQRIDYIRVSTLDQHTERSRSRKGGRKFGLTKAQVRLAQTAMKNQDTSVSELCLELRGITCATLYRYVSPTGELREHGKRVLQR